MNAMPIADSQDQRIERLYADFEAENLAPLWTQNAALMPLSPQPQAVSHVWRWKELLPIMERAGALVPVGRGGERRAVALANPGLGGEPYATPTLWAALQYLGPREVAPSHRHTQSAFRFVVEGEGVWTIVNGDSVAMRAGDLLLTPSMAWHEHHNAGANPMVWLDGLDIPLVRALDAGFFELGPAELTDSTTPNASRSERLWGRAGLQPLVAAPSATSPLVVYRWSETQAALVAQQELEGEGNSSVLEPGHYGVRYLNPATGGDALATIRLEFHRLGDESEMKPARRIGSSVWQVVRGSGTFVVDGVESGVVQGDLVVVPSWSVVAIRSRGGMDLFTFSDAPIYEALGLSPARQRREASA